MGSGPFYLNADGTQSDKDLYGNEDDYSIGESRFAKFCYFAAANTMIANELARRDALQESLKVTKTKKPISKRKS